MENEQKFSMFVKKYTYRLYALKREIKYQSQNLRKGASTAKKAEIYLQKISLKIDAIAAKKELYSEYLHQKIDELEQKKEELLSEKKIALAKRIKSKQFYAVDAKEYLNEVLPKALASIEQRQRLSYKEKRQTLKRFYAAQNDGGEQTTIEEKIEADLNEYRQQLDTQTQQYKAALIESARELFLRRPKHIEKKHIERFESAQAKSRQSFLEYGFFLDKKYFARIENIKQKLTSTINRLARELKLLRALYGNFLDLTDKKHILSQQAVLGVKNLCMRFGGLKAVDGLSFEVKQGEIFGLIGPNGAGKTTVFNCITQFYKCTDGEIFFRVKSGEVVRLNDKKVHDVITFGIARTFQNVEVVREVSVLDNLLIAAHRQFQSNFFEQALHLPIYKIEEKVVRSRAMKVLEFLGLLPYANSLAWGLPYGILKKIEIARTLMCNPQLIILDEPAAGLNEAETAELGKIIRLIQKEYNSTILLVEHDMGLVMEICDTVCAISFGKLLAVGSPKVVQSDKDVQTAYLGIKEENQV